MSDVADFVDMPTGPVYLYRAECGRVIDGDTYIMNIDLGFRVTTAIHVRLHGIDVFEIETEMGKKAAAYAQRRMTYGTPLILVQSYKDRQSFARWVADIWVDGRLLADDLRKAGFEKVS